jgi:hypothetical protein
MIQTSGQHRHQCLLCYVYCWRLHYGRLRYLAADSHLQPLTLVLSVNAWFLWQLLNCDTHNRQDH